MSMRNVLLNLSLPFETYADQESSELILNSLLSLNCMVNHRYLLRNPETPLLYSSGVVYTSPEQSSPDRLPESSLRKVAKLLKEEGAEKHLITTILRILNGVEEFMDIPTLLARGKGDCNELTPWKISEYWRAGIYVRPWLVKEPNRFGGITYHALIQWPDGSSEDPSLILGMGGPARAADRAEEIRKNKERLGSYIEAAQILLAEGAEPSLVSRHIDMLGLIPK